MTKADKAAEPTKTELKVNPRWVEVVKGGRGRPGLKFKADMADLLTSFCLMGSTNVQLAEMFGVGLSIVDDWLLLDDAFSNAVHQGREVADAQVSKSLYQRSLGYSHPAVKIHVDKDGCVTEVPYTEHYPPDTTAAKFWLMNRRRKDWAEKVVQQHVGPDGEDGEAGPVLFRAVAPGDVPPDPDFED